MTKFLIVASGKGGVGKTITSINLGVALTDFGRDVVLMDANFHNPDVSLYLGNPKFNSTLNHALAGSKDVRQTAYLHHSGLKIIPSSINHDELARSLPSQMPNVIQGLQETVELVIIDTGNLNELMHYSHLCDGMLVITTPDLPSVANSLRAIRHAKDRGIPIVGIVLNKVKNTQIEMDIKNVEDILGEKVLSIIPEDGAIHKSVYSKYPSVSIHPRAESTREYKKLAAKIIGGEYKDHLDIFEKSSATHNIMRFLGLK